MQMSDKEILIKARKFIESPENWTKGYYATTKDGEHVDIKDPRAECFCSMGAVLKAVGNTGLRDLSFHILHKDTESGNVIDYNDDPNTTHSDILAVFDKAIEMAK